MLVPSLLTKILPLPSLAAPSGELLALVSFPLLFVVDGITSLTAAAVLSGFLWARRRSATAIAEHQAVGAARAAVFFTTSVVWRDRAALLFCISALLVNVVYWQHEGAIPLYLVRDLRYRESSYGGLFVLNTLLIVALEVPLNTSMARWPARPTMALAAVLIAVGFGALGVAHAPLSIASTVVVWTFGEMIFFPTATAYVAELAPAGRTGEYMGAFAGTFSLALIVGPWLGVALLDRVGAPLTWTAMLVCGLAAAALAVQGRVDKAPLR